MHITGLVTCVDYAVYLRVGLPRWKSLLDRIVVVTSRHDPYTVQLCKQHDVDVYCTDAFYEQGAFFNKGKALSQTYDKLIRPVRDWLLFFDADIFPPKDLRDILDASPLDPHNLYGCYRTNELGEPINDPDIAGFFHLVHESSSQMANTPLLQENFTHAGNYDSVFQDQWPKSQRIRLPITVKHFGVPGVNWCGLGNSRELHRIMVERSRGKDWRQETI